MAETEVEANTGKSSLGGGFIACKGKNWRRRDIIARDSHLIRRREPAQHGIRGKNVGILKKIDGRTSFDQKKDLRRFVNGGELGDGLFDAIVIDLKIFAL